MRVPVPSRLPASSTCAAASVSNAPDRWGSSTAAWKAREQSLPPSPVAAAGRLLVLHVEDLPLDRFDNESPAIERRPHDEVVEEGGGHAWQILGMPVQDFTFRLARPGS